MAPLLPRSLVMSAWRGHALSSWLQLIEAEVAPRSNLHHLL